MNLSDLFGGGQTRPPAPEVATVEDVEQYNMEFLQKNNIEAASGGGDGDATMNLPFAKEAFEQDRRLEHKSEFPWLFDPSRGVRWDFDPVRLRNLGQENTWVGMLVQSITKEVAETPWTIVTSEDRSETRKRLQTHPEQRDPIAKANGEEFGDRTAERIHDLLVDPNPDAGWHDAVEQWMADLLEVGSATVVKYFPKTQYRDGDHGRVLDVDDSREAKPRALQTSAPEVWTKDYAGTTGLLDGFWQFEHEKSPGRGDASGGQTGTWGYRTPIQFDKHEVMWTDMSPRSNRRYGMPPTLLVEDFLKSLDLAISQEQQYLSKGSVPSGAIVFEGYDREELKAWKTENEENIKGKPWKMLTIAGKDEGVSFEPFSHNFQEMQYTERMQWYARVVASVFQVPTAVVGIEPENINYHTFQGERENFEENTLGPYLQKLERFINSELIRPHWGSEYHFEFKPGISETTRQSISDRVRSEWNSDLLQRSEALHELGREIPEDAEDGYKSDVVDEPADDGGLGEMLNSAMSKDTDTFEADVFRLVAPEDADYVTEDVVGIGVDFPNDDVYVDWRNEVFEDELEHSHVSIYGSIDDLEQATDNTVEPTESLDAAAESELAASVVKSAVGDGVSKGDPTRENHQVDPGSGVGVCENTGNEFECETMGDLAGDCPHCGDPISYIDEDDLDKTTAKASDMAVEFPNAGGPAFERRATLINFCDDLAEVCDGGVFVGENQYPEGVTGDGDGESVRVAGINERKAYAVWSRYRDEAVALSNPQTIDRGEVGKGGSGNANLRKDEPLRETDEWYQFDVQPEMVEDLQSEIADDIRELFDEVLSDDEIQRLIDRMAADDDDIEKSTTGIARRLKELLSQTRIAGDIADAVREQSTDAVRETLEETVTEADPDDPASSVDIDAVTDRLSQRDVAFANRFADELAEDIRDTIGDGYAEGKNSFEIREDIAEQADISEGWNGAERIARQELQIATGEARSAVAADLGKVEVWNTAGDDRVRPAHAEMGGAWKTPGEAFEVDYSAEGRGVQKESVPGDSEPGIGCRCTTLLRDREDVDESDYAGDTGIV